MNHSFGKVIAMYVKIRRDGALGIGRGSEGDREITIGYGEAHMIAAALEKLTQTARSFRQIYKKTTDVGAGNKIEFLRSDQGALSITGDGHTFFCSEEEIKELASVLKNLPPVEIAPASDFVQKVKPKDGLCVRVTNNSNSLLLTLPEAAVIKTSVRSSLSSRYYHEKIRIGNRILGIERTSDLKWELTADGQSVKFTAYEIEGLIAGLHNSILNVLIDTVKIKGSDDIADIRVKSLIQRIEQEATKLLKDHKKGKSIVKELVRFGKKVLGTSTDADERAIAFIEMVKYIHSRVEPEYHKPLFNILTMTMVTIG